MEVTQELVDSLRVVVMTDCCNTYRGLSILIVIFVGILLFFGAIQKQI
tara:strand:+ start:41 stop:184 length:144 start_codon:yes stop_codon:yes gene_type:complete